MRGMLRKPYAEVLMFARLRTTLCSIALVSICGSSFAQEAPDPNDAVVLYEGQALVLKNEDSAPKLVPFYCQRVGQEFYVRVVKETAVAVLCPTTTQCEASAAKPSMGMPVPTLSSPKVCLSGWLPLVIPEASVPKGLQRIEISL